MIRTVAHHVLHTRVMQDAVSEIWFAHHEERTSQQGIVRVLDVDVAGGAAIEACLRDVRAAATLRHRNVVSVLGVGDRDTPYVLSRYVPFEPLTAQLGTRWTLDETIDLARPLADVLDTGAAAGLAHGAVHPRTVWLDRRAGRIERRPLLAGFGLHHLLADVAGSGRLTEPLDDFLYVAPELLRGAAPTNRSDQYALAAAVHHALTGRPLFERQTLSALFGAHLFAQPSGVERVGADASASLDEIMARALAKDPDQRFDHCGDFVDALVAWQRAASGQSPSDAAVAAVPATVSPTPPPDDIDRRSRRELPVRPLIATAAVAGVIVLALLAVTFGRGPMVDGRGAASVATRSAASRPEPVPRDPAVRWRVRIDGARPTAMHVTSAGLLIDIDDHTLVVDPDTGQVRGDLESGGGGVVADGDRYVTGDDGNLRAVDVADGTVRWQIPIATASTPTAVDDTVYGISDADVPQLIAMDAQSGERLWVFPEDEVAFPAETAVEPADDFVYLADDEAVYGILPVGAIAGEDTEMITASEPATEPLCLWRHEVDEKMWTSSLRAVDRGVAVANRSGTVCLRAHVDGERLWCVPVEGVADSRPTLYEAGDRIVVVTRDAITALDSRTGAQAWRQAGPWRRTVRGGDRLVAVQADGRLATVSLWSGALRRPVDAKVGKGALLAVDGDALYAGRRNGTVLSIDLTG
ncbi:MAG TPA: PQQ-binding-like beta-propeller repeat protein [Euzebyales bacterium]